jgi:hypothetical protein
MAQGQITAADIQAVSDGAGVSQLLAKLGYDVSDPAEQTAAGLGVAERVQHLIRMARRLVGQRSAPGLPPALEIYWFETTTLTADLRQAVVASFRNKPAQVLLLMTTRDFIQLDFVLVQKSLAVVASGGQVTVSHQLFSVDRRHPSRVHLRVVNRITNVAADPFAQFDRIRDAFRLAEWSEDEFNNRNLFSDYFLKHRLTQPSQFPVWQADAKPAFKQLAGAYQAAGDARSLSSGDYLVKLIKPLLHGLGFVPLPGPAGDGQADFLLKPASAPVDAPPVAGLLVYPWDRPLDRKDDQDGPRSEDVPGIRIVKVLEEQKLPWAILTNGKDWRLYSAQAHSRATNYYEIDLPDALEHQDLIAFRYFYLFFRADAFVPAGAGEPSFLDQLLEGSAAFAKELGDRLRKHIFDDVFPYLAQGFVDYRRQAKDEKTPAADPFLDQTYDATLTLLYRLLFLLYAESLDLLPVHEPAYAALSLWRLKQQIADSAGKMTEQVEERLKSRFTKSSTTLYDGLVTLFTVIDKGSQDHNVPTYNGGLFATAPDAADQSREAHAARFLQTYKVPDFYLARALDLLARSEDAKTGDLVFVDYKSLGVRQLGSVYEGLLMYHVVIPRDDWEKGYKRPGLKVALVPSNQERKNTGSYFTPQHIVKYIVSQTVGPLLDEKFQEATPKLRAAQREYHDQRKYEADRNLAPVLRKAEEIVFKKHADVVRELLDVKVLDPAMGSGHFLVETVDFITDRVLNFLAGFPWNPVQVFVERRVRRPIVDSLEAQGVKINEQRLTDVNLIKRLVMKRCAYGVDLNPMAVELAKVSVWLDSFTIGAPLSFMDHHFKCGNSLIGSSIAELKKLAAEQGGLWTIPMEPLERATRNMELIADLSDVTLTEVHQSAETYQRVLAGVKGYRVLLDCMTAEHFGVRSASSMVTQGHDLDLEHWDQAVTKLSTKERGWVDDATSMSNDKRFFHWDVDFPDVFFTNKRFEGRRAFDVILGNPPYDELSAEEGSASEADLGYFRESPHYAVCRGGHTNLFELFIARIHHVGFVGSAHSFIVPMRLLADSFATSLRTLLLQNDRLEAIEAFPQKDDSSRRVFTEAKLSTVVYVARLFTAPDRLRIRTHPWDQIEVGSPAYAAQASELLQLTQGEALIPIRLDEASWRLLQKIEATGNGWRLGTVGRWASGEIMEGPTLQPYLTSAAHGVRLTRGGNVARYEFKQEPKQGEEVYVDLARLRLDRARSVKLSDQDKPRIAFQEASAVDNYRRLIAASLPRGTLCGKKLSYCCDATCSLDGVLAILNSALLEWRFNVTSTTNSVTLPEVSRLPFIANPSESDDFRSVCEHAALCSQLGMDKEKLQAQFKTELCEIVESDTIEGWTGSTRLKDLDYLGWEGRLGGSNDDASVRPASQSRDDFDGNLLCNVYPSYPVEGINERLWEASAWTDLCDLLRKNKSKIGTLRIKADLTGSGAVAAATGPMKKLQETLLKYHREVRQNRAKAAELDFLIDRIVFRLFDLTLDEQKLILSRVGPGRPLPPRRSRGGKAKPAAKDEGPGLFGGEAQ